LGWKAGNGWRRMKKKKNMHKKQRNLSLRRVNNEGVREKW